MNPVVWVMGAGLVGAYIGGRLAATGTHVRFIGRAQLGQWVAQNGLTLSDLDGHRVHVATPHWHLSPPQTPSPTLVLLCVKSTDTQEAMRQLAPLLPPGTVVLSFQNGVDNTAIAQAAAPDLAVLPGMVPFNVVEVGPGHLHQGTSGQLMALEDARLQPWTHLFAKAGLPLMLRQDMRAVQWAKLLLNLNNPINALSQQPLRAQLLQREWRRCTAALIDEALCVLAAARIPIARITPVPPQWLPTLLRAPTPVFRALAARMLRIDDAARSSMAVDLERGRPPEIDALCGAVVRLGAQFGVPTPRIAAVIKRLSGPTQAVAAAQLLHEFGL